MENCNALILMATYNGEKYISQQIDSILNQTFTNWKLIIRDDGSCDDTVKIIQSFAVRDERIVVLENKSSIHGAYQNFWWLANHANELPAFNYYLFSDQDDIWLSNKIEKMIANISSKKNKPCLAYADMQIIDGAGKLVYESLDKLNGLSEIGQYSQFFAHAFVAGCNAIINRKLFELVPPYPYTKNTSKIMAHDSYYTKFALACGEVVYLNFPGIQYRRHGNNVTKETYKLTPQKVLEKATGVFGELAKTNGRVYAQTLLTIEQMKKAGVIMPDIACIEAGIKAGGIKGVNVLKKYHVQRKQKSRTIGLYVVMLLGTYKKYVKEFMEM